MGEVCETGKTCIILRSTKSAAIFPLNKSRYALRIRFAKMSTNRNTTCQMKNAVRKQQRFFFTGENVSTFRAPGLKGCGLFARPCRKNGEGNVFGGG